MAAYILYRRPPLKTADDGVQHSVDADMAAAEGGHLAMGQYSEH